MLNGQPFPASRYILRNFNRAAESRRRSICIRRIAAELQGLVSIARCRLGFD